MTRVYHTIIVSSSCGVFVVKSISRSTRVCNKIIVAEFGFQMLSTLASCVHEYYSSRASRSGRHAKRY
jgi:hypothetical protein